VNLREAINQLSYGDDVSKHIATNEWRNDDLINVRLAPISGAEADIS
jgi:hypothetical protein